MPLFRRLATIVTAAEVARRYAKSHPEQTAKFVDQAAKFADKQTKGRYAGQIQGAAQRVKSVAGIKGHATPDAGSNGYLPGAPTGSTYGNGSAPTAHDSAPTSTPSSSPYTAPVTPTVPPTSGQEPGRPTAGSPAV